MVVLPHHEYQVRMFSFPPQPQGRRLEPMHVAAPQLPEVPVDYCIHCNAKCSSNKSPNAGSTVQRKSIATAVLQEGIVRAAM